MDYVEELFKRIERRNQSFEGISWNEKLVYSIVKRELVVIEITRQRDIYLESFEQLEKLQEASLPAAIKKAEETKADGIKGLEQVLKFMKHNHKNSPSSDSQNSIDQVQKALKECIEKETDPTPFLDSNKYLQDIIDDFASSLNALSREYLQLESAIDYQNMAFPAGSSNDGRVDTLEELNTFISQQLKAQQKSNDKAFSEITQEIVKKLEDAYKKENNTSFTLVKQELDDQYGGDGAIFLFNEYFSLKSRGFIKYLKSHPDLMRDIMDESAKKCSRRHNIRIEKDSAIKKNRMVNCMRPFNKYALQNYKMTIIKARDKASDAISSEKKAWEEATQESTEDNNNYIAQVDAEYVAVRLVYADDPSQPVRAARVLCWEYAADQASMVYFDGATSHQIDDHPLKSLSTDESGFLMGALVDDEHLKTGRSNYHFDMKEKRLSAFHQRNRDEFKSTVERTLGALDEKNSLFYSPHAIDYHFVKPQQDRYVNSPYAYAGNFIRHKFQQYLDTVDQSAYADLTPLKKGHRYGFFIAPDTDTFVTRDLLTLAEPAGKKDSDDFDYAKHAPKSQTAATTAVVQSGSSISLIKVHCTLPGWTQRIQTLTTELSVLQGKAILPVAQSLSDLKSLREMQEINDLNLVSPGKPSTHHELTRKLELKRSLSLVQDHISKQLATPDKFHIGPSKFYQDKCKELATTLFNTLSSPALMAELTRYNDYAIKERFADGGDLTSGNYPGPDMLEEERWQDIYDAIEAALRALSQSALRGRVEEELIKPLFEYLEKIPVKETNEGTLGLRDIVPLLKSAKLNTDEISALVTTSENAIPVPPNVLAAGWSIWADFKQDGDLWFHRLPGPNSILMVVLDSYSYFPSWMIRVQGKLAQGERGARLINIWSTALWFLTKNSFFKDSKDSMQNLVLYKHLKSIEVISHLRKIPVDGLVDRLEKAKSMMAQLQQGADHGYNQAQKVISPLAKAYVGAVCLTGLVTRVQAAWDLKETTAEDGASALAQVHALNTWLGLGSGVANGYSFLLKQNTLHKLLKSQLSSSALPNGIMNSLTSKKGVSIFCDRFATTLNVFAAVEMTLMAQHSYGAGKQDAMVGQLIEAAGSVILAVSNSVEGAGVVGTALGTIGITISAELGVVIAIGGSAVMLIGAYYDNIADWSKDGIHQQYAWAYQSFGNSAQQSEYLTEQSWQREHYPGLGHATKVVNEADGLVGQGDLWQTLNWKAVIPVFNRLNNDPGRSRESALEKTADVVGENSKYVRDIVKVYEKWLKQIDLEIIPPRLPVSKVLLKEAVANLEAGIYVPHENDHVHDVFDRVERFPSAIDPSVHMTKDEQPA